MPKVLAFVGLASLTCVGLALSAKSGIGQEKETQAEAKSETKGDAKPKAEADPKEASTKETAKEEPKEPLPDVVFISPQPLSEAESAALGPVHDAIKAFARDFNAHDLKAVTDSYTSQAEITNQAGVATRGREAINGVLAKLFKDFPTVKIQFEVHSVRYLSPELAVEEGISFMTSDANSAAEAQQDHYTMTHVKQDGKWLIASARDLPAPPPNGAEELKKLEWLVGDWVDENGDTLVATTYRWSDDKNFLLSDYSIHRKGRTAIQGTQRIGWDPRYQQLRSWSFNTEGGFSEGLWSHTDNQWISKITGVSRDGLARSATRVLTRLSQDHATMQTRDRVTGGELMPDLPEVPIVRKPPQPMRAAK